MEESHEDLHQDIRSMGQEQCGNHENIEASTRNPCAWKAVEMVVQGSEREQEVASQVDLVDIVNM
jgi:hypothetical protein